MVPGHTACFDCSKVRPYDRQIAQDEFFSPRAVKFARAQGYLKEAPEDQSVAVYGLNLQCIGALITELQNYVAPYRNPAFFISNEAEYSTRYVASDTRNAIHDGLIAGLRFPMTHAATQADEDCPHCGSWRLGRMESLDIAYPHVAKESVEAALPDPLAYLE